MTEKQKKIRVIKKPSAKDKLVKEALAIAKNYKVFSFSESYAILEPQLEIANTTHEQK